MTENKCLLLQPTLAVAYVGQSSGSSEGIYTFKSLPKALGTPQKSGQVGEYVVLYSQGHEAKRLQ